MNRRLSLVVILLTLVVLTSFAHAQNEGGRMNLRADAPRDVAGGGLPITDIRAGDMETVGIWREKGGLFTQVICSDSTCGTVASASPRNGLFWAWFGRSANAQRQFIEQPLYIPRTAAVSMTFFYWVGIYAAESNPKFQLKIDGQKVWSTPITGTTAGYQGVTVDLSAFSDGGLHTIKFIFKQTAGGITNINLDDIAFYKGSDGLVFNPGFETGMSSWNQANPTGDMQMCNTPEKTYSYTGACAFMFKGSAGENSALWQTYGFLSRAEGDILRAPPAYRTYLGAMVKSSPAATGSMKFILTFSNGTKKKGSVSLAGTGAYTWIQTPPKRYSSALEIAYVEMSFKNTSPTGKIFIDDVELVETADYS